MPNERERNWVFTLNNYEAAEYEQIIGTTCRYLIVGKEKGESGTPHLQGYIVFKNKTSLKAVKNIAPRAHWEHAKGNSLQNFVYCSKGGDYVEIGDRPLTPQEKGEGEKKRYKRAWELAKEGKIEDIDPDIRVRHYGTIKRIKSDHQVPPPSIEETDFWWFTGPTGTGKSRTAREENPWYYDKNINKWWDGYVDQKCVIIENWSPNVVRGLQQKLKQWCGHHPFAAETKGSTTCIRPKKIIITSNYTMAECFGHDIKGLLEPLSRQLQIRTFI